MVRDGTAANARNMCVIVSASNGYRIQLRSATGGESASIAPVEIPNAGAASSSTPVTFKLVKKRGKIEVTINGVHATYTGGIDIDVSGWSPNLCVGLALTSHSGARLSTALVTDVTFTVKYPTGTVLSLR